MSALLELKQCETNVGVSTLEPVPGVFNHTVRGAPNRINCAVIS